MSAIDDSRKTIAYFLGTYEDWGGASRALLNFVRSIDRTRFKPLVVLTQEGRLSAQLGEEGIDWMLWQSHDSSKNYPAYARHVWRAYRMFKRSNIDLIHLNHGALGWKPAEIVAARLAGIPLISHIHITLKEPSRFLRFSTAVVAVSDYIATHSNTLGVPTHAIHNVSYLQRFAKGHDIRDRLGYSKDEVLIIYMGQMIRQKGIELLIDSFTRLTQPNVRLLLAGGIRPIKGAYSEEEVQALVARDARIRYLGFLQDAENLYRTADIMVMPSQWEEPCAMILFEAAAAGRPVIASNTGGTPEILRHSETGFLFERTDVDALTTYMNMLVDNEPLRQQLGANAARVAELEFSHGPVEKMERLYERLL